MNVTDAVRQRYSARAFTDRVVPLSTLREVVELAARAPSGGNLQPWHLVVVGGQKLVALKDRIRSQLQQGVTQETPEYEIYPPKLWEPHRTQRFALGEAMYELLGIPRDDKPGRLRQFARNYECFGAPQAIFCFVDRRMGPPQWADLGMYLQTLMLLLRERGIDSCAQESWSVFPQSVAAELQPADGLMLFCGLSVGYADPDAPVNRLRSARMPVPEFAEFLGFD